jgi:hypothetical protein
MSQLAGPLSMGVGDPMGAAATMDIKKMMDALREGANIDLPDDTTEANFMERLATALRQKKASEAGEEEGSLTNPPEGAEEKPAPVAMSQEAKTPKTDEQIVDLVMAHPQYKAATETIGFLMGHITQQSKQTMIARRNALISSGRCTEDYAKAHIDPLVEAFQMSFTDNGQPKPSPVESIITALESAPSMTGNHQVNSFGIAMSQLPTGLQEEVFPQGDAFSEEDAENIAMNFLKNMGHVN